MFSPHSFDIFRITEFQFHISTSNPNMLTLLRLHTEWQCFCFSLPRFWLWSTTRGNSATCGPLWLVTPLLKVSHHMVTSRDQWSVTDLGFSCFYPWWYKTIGLPKSSTLNNNILWLFIRPFRVAVIYPLNLQKKKYSQKIILIDTFTLLFIDYWHIITTVLPYVNGLSQTSEEPILK